MPFDAAAKESMLDHVVVAINGIATHSADPGVGADNETSASRPNPTFASASGDEIALASPVDFTGDPNVGATWFTVWAGATRYGKGQITTGDTQYNAAGEYTLTTGTRLRLLDPA